MSTNDLTGFKPWNLGRPPTEASEFVHFQRIRLKYIKEILGQLDQDATGIHLLRAEEAAIKEFLGEPR